MKTGLCCPVFQSPLSPGEAGVRLGERGRGSEGRSGVRRSHSPTDPRRQGNVRSASSSRRSTNFIMPKRIMPSGIKDKGGVGRRWACPSSPHPLSPSP
jgi:hypothetical protein